MCAGRANHADPAKILRVNPARTYWRNNQQEPGRWPSPKTVNNDPTHP